MCICSSFSLHYLYCSWRQAVESSCSRFGHCDPNHLACWLLRCRNCILFIKSRIMWGGSLMFPFSITNYYRKDQSENVIWSSFQRSCTAFMLLSKCRILGFYSSSCSLQARFNDFRLKSNLRWGAIELIFVPFWSRATWRFLQEFVRERIRMRYIKWGKCILLKYLIVEESTRRSSFMFLLKCYFKVNQSSVTWNPISGYTRGHF